jgi:acyl carrier protein
LFTAIGKTMPELAGIIHSAMVLDDATIANLSSEQLSRVLAPKVNGAVNLDRATRDMSLAYFVLYSSVTTLIGNPGQGSYVAANAFMEGLARRRRQNGLPALAVGWGPIADVGVVARNEKLQGSLRKLGSVRGMLAREALDLLAQALSVTQTDPALAVITIAPHEGGFSAGRLPILKSPTFAGFVNATLAAASGSETIDLKALMATDDVETVRDLVTENVVAQLANVLHFRTEDIVHLRPLSDLGLDSLMALELAMKLEDCFGIQLQLTGSAGDLTVASLVDEIMAHANVDREDDENTVASTLAEKHFGDIETVDAATFPEATGVKIYSRQGRPS